MSENIYLSSKKRVEDVLSSTAKIKKVNSIKDLSEVDGYQNGIKTWIAALAIDIRNAASLFSEEDNADVIRITKAFFGEANRIARSNPRCIQTEIQGDKFFAYYATPGQNDLVQLLEDAVYLNTFHAMLIKILDLKNMPVFDIGIGISSSECIIARSGDAGSPYIFIGDAVFNATRLARQGNKDGFGEIIVDRLFYDNVKNYAANEKQGYWEFFKRKFSKLLNMWCFHTSAIDAAYSEWIDQKVK